MPRIDQNCEVNEAARENITDIPLDKTPPLVQQEAFPCGSIYAKCGRPAVGAGKVQICCWINRKCPFTKSWWFNDALIFNTQTVASFPKKVLSQIRHVPGVDGIFPPYEINYRHSFVKAYYWDDSSSINSPEIKENWLKTPGGSFLNGWPDYAEQQAWIISPTIFSDHIIRPDHYKTRFEWITGFSGFGPGSTLEESFCTTLPQWSYSTKNLPKIPPDDEGHNISLLEQTTTSLCKGAGVHWRLVKSQPLFRGEDFFIQFHKRAMATDIPSRVELSLKDDPNLLAWKLPRYASVDVRNEDKTQIAATGSNYTYRNFGVVSYDEEGNAVEKSSYDFTNQAYYVVEIGMNDPEHNYLFLITQNGPIRCINLWNEKGAPSITVGISDFKDSVNLAESAETTITGNSLIEADWFRMVVRNHLGKLVVEFEGPNIKSQPWVIEKFDLIPSSVPGIPDEEPRIMVVPHGVMSIWGGNLLSGFFFGPLQYSEPAEGRVFTFPPKLGYGALQVEMSDINNSVVGYQRGKSFSLPAGSDESDDTMTNHKILLSATSNQVHDVANEGFGITTTPIEHFFTQDAQKFSWFEGNVAIAGEHPVSSEYKTLPAMKFANGTFMKSASLRESCPSYIKKSEIKVWPFNVIRDVSNYVDLFKIAVRMMSGDHLFNWQDLSGEDRTWILEKCKPPVMSMIRLVGEPESVDRWDTSNIEFECGDQVLSFEDSWSASDFTKVEHTGTIKFLTTMGSSSVAGITNKLYNLRNKNFFIEVWAGYVPESCNTKMPYMYKLFTGMCTGGEINQTYGRSIMTCQVKDYSQILNDQMFFNSPFFDGVIDINAVREIMRMGGFKWDNPDDPLSIIDKFADSTESTQDHIIAGQDGRISQASNYALPSAYARIQNPFFKFKDGTKLIDGIMQLAKRAGKVFFFDSHGVGHYEAYLDTVIKQITSGTVPQVLFNFTTNPNIYPGQLVYNDVTWQESMIDVFNHIKILTNTPDFTPIFGDSVQWNSIMNPSTFGFVGYMKSLYQVEGIFGSRPALEKILNYYAVFKLPPFICKMETYGQPIRALDIVSINNAPMRVAKVDNSIDPSKNLWWQNIEGEWFYSEHNPYIASQLPSTP